MSILNELISFLEKRNLSKYASEIYKLAAPAEPFIDWFEGEERVYLDYSNNSGISEAHLRGKYPEVIKAISFMGLNTDEANLIRGYSGLKSRSKKKSSLNSTFFKDYVHQLTLSEDFGIDPLELGDIAKKVKDAFLTKKIDYVLEESFKDVISKDNNLRVIKFKNKIGDISANFGRYMGDELRSYSDYDKKVVISRNERDVLMMSTDRRWTSCLNIHDGEYSDEPHCEVKNGGFVAYLIKGDDEDIEDPLARIWIRNFQSQERKDRFIAIPETTTYGSEDEIFEKIVEEWIKSKQGEVEADIYNLRGSTYSDSYSSNSKFFGGKDKLEDFVLDMIKDPNKILKYDDAVYIVKDKVFDIPKILSDKELELTLNLSSEKIEFRSKEEAESFISIQSDSDLKNIDNILRRVAVLRIVDDIDLDDLKFWVREAHPYSGGSEDISDHYEEYVSDLYDSKESEYEDRLSDLNHFEDEYKEKLEYLQEEMDSELKPFDVDQQIYSYEKRLKDFLEKKERFELSEIPKEEYLGSLGSHKPGLTRGVLHAGNSVAKKISNKIEKEDLPKIKKLKGVNSNADVFYNKIMTHNPDIFEIEDIVRRVEDALEGESFTHRVEFIAELHKSSSDTTLKANIEKIVQSSINIYMDNIKGDRGSIKGMSRIASRIPSKDILGSKFFDKAKELLKKDERAKVRNISDIINTGTKDEFFLKKYRDLVKIIEHNGVDLIKMIDVGQNDYLSRISALSLIKTIKISPEILDDGFYEKILMSAKKSNDELLSDYQNLRKPDAKGFGVSKEDVSEANYIMIKIRRIRKFLESLISVYKEWM